MYIDGETIIYWAKLIGAIGVIGGAAWGAVKIAQKFRHLIERVNATQDELTLICYGLRGALQGLIEQGCNGPCKEALAKLDKHLNKKAHSQEV